MYLVNTVYKLISILLGSIHLCIHRILAGGGEVLGEAQHFFLPPPSLRGLAVILY